MYRVWLSVLWLEESPGQTPTKETKQFIWFGSPFHCLGTTYLSLRGMSSRNCIKLPQILEVSWSISLLMNPSQPAFPKGCGSCLVRQLCSNSRQRWIFLNVIPLIKIVCTLWLKHIRIHSEAWRLATSLDLHFQFDYKATPKFSAVLWCMHWGAMRSLTRRSCWEPSAWNSRSSNPWLCTSSSEFYRTRRTSLSCVQSLPLPVPFLGFVPSLLCV